LCVFQQPICIGKYTQNSLTLSFILVNEIEIPIRRLINASKRIILSNVYPTIPNQLILEAINEQGIKTTSSISHMKTGFFTDQFLHFKFP
jgi:hypothetical protein